MYDLTTERSFDSQATLVIDVLGSFCWYVIHGCLYNPALSKVRSTGAGIKCLYCITHPESSQSQSNIMSTNWRKLDFQITRVILWKVHYLGYIVLHDRSSQTDATAVANCCFFLSINTCSTLIGGLPWWLSGLRHCYWLLTVSHHWGPVLMVEWSKALRYWLLTVSHHWGPALMVEWFKTLLLTAPCLSPLRACPDGWVV